MPSAAAGVQVRHLRRVCPLGTMEQYLSPVAELVNNHDLSRAVVVDGAVGQVPPFQLHYPITPTKKNLFTT